MRTPEQIEPVYRTPSTNSSVELGGHRAMLLYGDRRGPQGDATFALRLSPYPRLVGSMQLPEYVSTDDVTAVELPALSARFSVLRPNVVISGSGTEITLHPNPDRIEVFHDAPTKLREVIFHILNFHDFYGGKTDVMVRTETSLRRLGCIVLEADGWRVTIHALPETQSLVRTLSSEGGYAITHVGRLERIRRGAFRATQAKAFLEMLRLYLSFARGSFVSCPLAVGSDACSVKWEQWGSHIVYSWRSFPGWFSSRPATLLEKLFPGFVVLYKSRLWNKPLQAVLYWYLRANNTSEGAGVDGGIILAQAALEKLAWAYLVEDAQIVTAKQFRSWWTSRRIAELLAQLDIPLTIPVKLRVLRTNARRYGWANGPVALTEVRNDLVHAEEKYLKRREKLFFEAWSFAQQYIELVILRLANYSGQYTDRIAAKWVGETTKVPWA